MLHYAVTPKNSYPTNWGTWLKTYPHLALAREAGSRIYGSAQHLIWRKHQEGEWRVEEERGAPVRTSRRTLCGELHCKMCEDLHPGIEYTIDCKGVVHWHPGTPPTDNMASLFRVRADNLKIEIQRLQERIDYKVDLLTKIGDV